MRPPVSYCGSTIRRFPGAGRCTAVVMWSTAVWRTGAGSTSGTYDGRLVSLNAGDGSLHWEVQTTDPERPYTITGAPRIVRDKVIIGNGGAEFGVRGYVSAYNLDSAR